MKTYLDLYEHLDVCDGCNNKEWIRLFDNGNSATCANCDTLPGSYVEVQRND